MPSNRYSTEDVARHESFAYWRELVCDVFINLDCSTKEERSFGGAIKLPIPSWMNTRPRIRGP